MTYRWIHAFGTWIGGVLLTFTLWFLLHDHAFAQGFFGISNFRCNGTVASGDLMSPSSACPQVLDPTNIFSFTVCHVESITSQIFGNLYCGVITQLTPAVSAVLTLAVLFFGVGFTIGVISATGREFLLFMLNYIRIQRTKMSISILKDSMVKLNYIFLMFQDVWWFKKGLMKGFKR
jgi:hypothetical protein